MIDVKIGYIENIQIDIGDLEPGTFCSYDDDDDACAFIKTNNSPDPKTHKIMIVHIGNGEIQYIDPTTKVFVLRGVLDCFIIHDKEEIKRYITEKE